jgi:uncharacterized protein YndB with AHSA1/START domain
MFDTQNTSPAINRQSVETETKNGKTAIILECLLPHRRETVWRALGEPELLAAWLLPGTMPRNPKPGDRFHLFPETKASNAPAKLVIECEIIEAKPPAKLSFHWRETAPAKTANQLAKSDTDHRTDKRTTAPPDLESIVTFTLIETANGFTRLRLVHDGFVAQMISPRRMIRAGDTVMAASPLGPVGRNDNTPRPARFFTPVCKAA